MGSTPRRVYIYCMNNNEIIILGTGNAMVTRCYNTCFIVRSESGSMMLVDAGGGNGILSQLQKAGVGCEEIDDLFITHAHTDHILGVIWLMRMALQYQKPQQLKIHSHKKVLDLIDYIARQTLPQKQVDRIGVNVVYQEFGDGDSFQAGDMQVQCFDIHSTKEKQFGFTVTFANGKRLACLGDEPYCELNEPYVKGADWMMSEAFCLYADRERFQPYKKHHSTALDAARLAKTLGVPNLILYHTEDKTLDTRKERYSTEAQSVYDGQVFVPYDLERIAIV